MKNTFMRVYACNCLIAITGLAGCGGGVTSPQSAKQHESIPAQAVNDTSLGLIRVRLQSQTTLDGKNTGDAFEGWMMARGLDATKAIYFLDQLKAAGFDTILAVIPGDERFLEDLGFYVGGSPDSDTESVEDILIKTGGLFGATLTVEPIGNGWFYIGINGDGIIEGASNKDAIAVSSLLQRIGDKPAAAILSVSRMGFAANRAIVRTAEFAKEQLREAKRRASLDEMGMSPDQNTRMEDDPNVEQLMEAAQKLLPKKDSRLVRRLRGIGNSLLAAEAIAAIVDNDATSKVLLVFRTEADATALTTAIEKMKKDMLLAIQGSVEQNEITLDEAQIARNSLDSLQFRQQGSTIALSETLAVP